MRTLALAAVLLSLSLTAKAQTMPDQDLVQRIEQLEDRAALKTLVDTFSNLADEKRVEEQTLLFTEDAEVTSYVGGERGSSFQGRQQIGEAFAAYLALFDTVYHINGQQTVEIEGDRATGTSYCQVVLIGTQDGQRTKNTSGVIYSDEYVRQDGRWLIARRTSNFTWRTVEDMPPAP